MNYETYRFIHFAGIFILLFAFGSLFASDKSTKGAAIGHGIGLLLILLGGFGMQAKMKDLYQAVYGSGFPMAMIIKLVIWLVFGGCMVLAKRRIVNGVAAWVIILALAFASMWLGRTLTLKQTPSGGIPAPQSQK